ncbi:DUF2177 family protein [Alkalibacter rhizosphaerae]|uniref:DUF2177 family protein n=1 Tax=Alkalibacter rhizosphaerae TaxID=2815577 RepID=A0A974XFP9_9FIRM|nr:DUF2177 family protein [Alkalibacter rhizosphaerae]QSX08856.1 DUF2177 family protein [Alkalibacter rhizosphaerae]
MQIVKIYLVSVVVFFAIDLVWLGVIAKNLYQKYLGYLMRNPVNWAAAIIFYLIFVAGMVFFVIHPALEKGSFSYAILVGALFGFITYATYDLTNLATVRDWPLFITVVDLIWGTTLGALTSGIAFFVVHTFLSQ